MKIEPGSLTSIVQARSKNMTDQLETAFLTEMLKIAIPESEGSFSGGVGEAQFASFLAEYRAKEMADRLDLGLLSERENFS